MFLLTINNNTAVKVSVAVIPTPLSSAPFYLRVQNPNKEILYALKPSTNHDGIDV